MTKTMLLIDDLMFHVRYTERILQDCSVPHEILAVTDSVEALKELDKTTVDLILLDLKTPRTDAFDLLKVIRATPRLSQIPVIILTPPEREKDFIRARIFGIVEQVRKTEDYSNFREHFMTALSRHRLF